MRPTTNHPVHKYLFFLSIPLCLMACGGDDNLPNSNNGNGANGNNTGGSTGTGSNNGWLIPLEEIRDGGPGKDGIPALDNPEMIMANEATYLNDDDLIVGYKFEDQVRAYPHKIFNWHEIVNDELNGRKVAITHCPLTGTSLGWEREYNGKSTTFGVSGLLFNTNLMPYDRTTNSTWIQIGELCVNGDLIGTAAQTFQVVETEWKTWKNMYPDTRVMSLKTGYSRNYDQYPYGDYRTEPGLIFSVSQNDTRRHQKERVHGVIVEGKAKLYVFDSFVSRTIISDTFMDENFIVAGSREKNIIVSFKEKVINSDTLTFTVINDFNSHALLKDQLGNEWDVFGNAISGPNAGEKLEATNSFIGMFFSWAPFYGEPDIFGY